MRLGRGDELIGFLEGEEVERRFGRGEPLDFRDVLQLAEVDRELERLAQDGEHVVHRLGREAFTELRRLELLQVVGADLVQLFLPECGEQVTAEHVALRLERARLVVVRAVRVELLLELLQGRHLGGLLLPERAGEQRLAEVSLVLLSAPTGAEAR